MRLTSQNVMPPIRGTGRKKRETKSSSSNHTTPDTSFSFIEKFTPATKEQLDTFSASLIKANYQQIALIEDIGSRAVSLITSQEINAWIQRTHKNIDKRSQSRKHFVDNMVSILRDHQRSFIDGRPIQDHRTKLLAKQAHTSPYLGSISLDATMLYYAPSNDNSNDNSGDIFIREDDNDIPKYSINHSTYLVGPELIPSRDDNTYSLDLSGNDDRISRRVKLIEYMVREFDLRIYYEEYTDTPNLPIARLKSNQPFSDLIRSEGCTLEDQPTELTFAPPSLYRINSQ